MPFTLFDTDFVEIDTDPQPCTEDLEYDETRKREYPACEHQGYTAKYIVSCYYPKGISYQWYRYCDTCDNMASQPMSERDDDNIKVVDGDRIIIPMDKYQKLERAKILHNRIHGDA